MEYIFALKVNELPSGTMKMVKLAGKDILITNFENQFYAISNVCTHLRGPLSNGRLEGKIVICPFHGAQFDVTTGKCTGPAKIAFIKTTPKDEPTFNVKVEGEDIFIGI
jgi:nitrite reductase/ring-hydroxylating ferredoxin subunit